jgi:hypothetical protein
MTEEDIQILRERYPIPFGEICLYNSFVQILGKKPEDYTEEERKVRWNKIMSLNNSMRKRWSETYVCTGCIHLNEKESWCNSQGLPCTYNPILTPSTGMIGMACMGIGREEHQQLKLDL